MGEHMSKMDLGKMDLKKPIRAIMAMCDNRHSVVARRLNITPSAIWQWERKGKIPLEQVPAIEREFGLSPIAQRPDYFGKLSAFRGLQEAA
jgi:DNA-binding transcriptional regulator YdaS (Cro superfamily)